MPESRRRKKASEVRVRETQGEQRRAESRKITLRAYRIRRFIGWSLVTVAVSVGVSHWLAHLGLWRFASPGVMDLVAGYPMAGVLGIFGSIVLTKT